MHSFFGVLGAPFFFILFALYDEMLGLKHFIKISKKGIECELFRDQIDTNFISWLEIDSIRCYEGKGPTMMYIYLCNKNRISRLTKFLHLSSGVRVNISNFEKTHQIIDVTKRLMNSIKTEK